ncbi:response regulator transcription factor [Parvibaculum sp.]|uniref:response regulator n=1 Tax=Parvibaculum sp. TaxID=2024848 RepID=UPI001B013015|nr:response regulator transcription factor [Parvibaculum sp.]MBO6634917.1 response regulator transcription factor [Parvibaculum sp.]MBO6678831.1 response regulator transcription factor [Parvibaculum sp.]MBO6683759.1 response regulator transcription factor [Parvibaculum sp.]MBO6903960.1 response regulator transcription factor [Parvibaculum sp.]
MKKITTYLIDDHHVLRQAVVEMLEAEEDIVVVGQSGDARTGIGEIERLRPDVAVLDLKMPGMGGLAAIGEILKSAPRTGIIIFTMYDNPAYVWETTNAGASGYVLKSASKEDLLRAVRAVHAGAGYLQAEVTKPLLRRLAQDARSAGQKATLTSRELQVLECLAEGQSNKVIAYTLSITEDTVKAHLKSLYDKLDASDRAHAVAIALRQQLIE